MRCPECGALAVPHRVTESNRCVRCGWIEFLGTQTVLPDDDQGDLFATKGMVRKTDPQTSHEAARVVAPHVGKTVELILSVYRRRGPMSARKAERLPEFSSYGFSTIRRRITDLHRSGQLEECGIDHDGRAPATIYRVTAEAHR